MKKPFSLTSPTSASAQAFTGPSAALPGDAALDAVFTALADPTRRAILARLAQGEATVGELAEPFAMSQPAISKHLKVLERAGLVAGAREAQRRPRRLLPEPLGGAVDWLEGYRALWEARYARLDAVLATLVAAEKRPRRPSKKTASNAPERIIRQPHPHTGSPS